MSTTDPSAALPRTHPDLEVAAFDDGVVVYDDRNHMSHQLVGLHAALFDACSNRITRAQFEHELVEADPSQRHTAHDAVTRALTDLDLFGLLDGSEAPEAPPCLGCPEQPVVRIRRRRWYHR